VKSTVLIITSHITCSDIIKHEAVYIKYYDCVFVFLCQLPHMQALSLCCTFCQIVMACLALTFFLYLSCKGTIFGKRNVCFAPTNFIWDFVIPRRIQWNNNRN